MDEFLVFRKFQNEPDANDLAARLLEMGIVSEIEEQSGWLDNSILGEGAKKEIHVKIRQEDFDNANALMEQEADELSEAIDKDYYLFEFTDRELKDVAYNPDDWSEFDIVLAKKILQDRGNPVSEEDLAQDLKRRYDEMAKTEAVPFTKIIRGYVLSILGGIGGIMIGRDLWKSTKVIPDGRQVYMYKASDREHGRNMVIFGAIVAPVVIVYYLLKTNGYI